MASIKHSIKVTLAPDPDLLLISSIQRRKKKYNQELLKISLESELEKRP